jgi:DUF4097 and DUF4098 domain-containing protein YvlB
MKLLNKMKKLTKIIGITCATIYSVGSVSHAVAAENHLLVMDSNKMIRLDLQSGAEINLEVWDKQQVAIRYDDASQNSENYQITIDESHSGLNISSKALQGGIMQLSFDLKVPQQTQLCLSSGGGNIKVSGLTGGLNNCDAAANYNDGSVIINSKGGNVQVTSALEGANIKTGGGNINVKKATKYVFAETGGGTINIQLDNGTVRAHTGAGDIKVKVFNETAQSGDIELVTGLGDVWLYLPEGYSMNLDVEIAYTADTDGAYEVDAEFPFSLAASAKQSSSGTARKYLHGAVKLNHARHNVSIKTTNGNVYIREI